MGIAIAVLAVIFAVATAAQPFVAAAVPAVFLTALLCARRPAGAMAIVLVFSGSFGSLQAFGVFSPGPYVDLILAGLWIAVIVSHLVKERDRPWWIWPGVALLILYIAITFFEIPTAVGMSIGVKSFRYSTWYMAVLPLLALAGWSLNTYIRISKALIAVAVLVGAYAVLRLIIGPASSEQDFALQGAGTFNVVEDKLALIGSFPSRHSLAFWATTATPFCLAASFTMRKGWRLAALLAVGLCVTAVLGTQVRAALPALVVGGITVVVLHQVAGGMKGGTIGKTIAAIMIAFVVGAALFSMVVGEDSSRYSAIFSPSGDTSYEHRITKWTQAIEDIQHDPFGKGLGTAGLVQELGQGPYITEGSYGIDSSYLKIAYEQGFPILALFILAMIVLLINLAMQAVRVEDERVRAMLIGAAGTLVAALSMFITAIYIENLPVLVTWTAVGTAIGATAAARAERQEEPVRAPAPEPDAGGGEPLPVPSGSPA
jgi:hypothetical protein